MAAWCCKYFVFPVS